MKTLWSVIAVLAALLVGGSAAIAQDNDKAQAFAPPKKDWEWDEDKRFDFLIERLASLEASLDAVERAIAKASGKRGTKQGQARRAEANNTMMDRKGGGPMRWNEFYGTTAEKFFYHPVDPNTTYHTNTALRQMGSAQDDKVGNGVPASQSVPVHQRPPQFDYIYRANRDAQQQAEKEAIALSGQIEELNRRRAQLEDEQAELWCLLAFRAIQRQNIPKKPMLRYAMVPSGTSPDATQRLEALSAATRFLAAALLVIDKSEQDQSTALTGIKQVVGPARSQFDDALVNLDTLEEDVANKKRKLGQFVALAQLLDDTASNLSESYVAAIDGDRFKDEARKDRFRGLLQRSLVEYAQIILALDELTDAMRKEWQIKVDTKTPVSSAEATWPVAGRNDSPSVPPNPPKETGSSARSLFNGRDLTGWDIVTIQTTTASPEKAWSVDSARKVLRSNGGNLVDLQTQESFDDFTFSCEWRFLPGEFVGPNGTGIIVRANGLNKLGLDPAGVEIELRIDQPGDDERRRTGGLIAYDVTVQNHSGKVDGQKRNGNFSRNLAYLRPAALLPVGEWNTTEVECRGDRLKVMINGVVVNEAWGMGSRRGHICLRNQKSAAEFRNISVTP